ncbi:AAA family ATPase [Microbulbifer sp. TRSA001]|uniref:AAA family ATPase n=1 Tax=Microbulbifer sp. TRSA001 TaxID=3243381 RepID=UPI004039E8BA
MKENGTLILFCEKMGAGKSTKAVEVAQNTGAILISENEWLSNLYPREICSLSNYIEYSSRLKSIIKPHIQNILKHGTSVILDFPGNTRRQRSWFKEILQDNFFPHQLIYLKAEDELCLQRITQRQKSHTERATFDNPETFKQVNQYFEEPTLSERFNIEVIEQREISK